MIFFFYFTIVDTLPVVLEFAKEVLGNLLLTSKKDIDRYKNMTVKQLLKEFKIPLIKIPKYVTLARTFIKQKADEIKMFKGLDKTVKQLKQSGYSLYIVSSNSVDVINHLLDKYHLNSYFDSVVGGVGVFGKTVAIKGTIKRYKIDSDNVVYIGDEVRDIKAAKRLKVPIVSVTWGFNGEKVLKKNNPDAIATKPSDIVPAVEKVI